MMADAQTDYRDDYWTNCKTGTRNLSEDWLRCYDLLFLLQGNLNCNMLNAYAVKISLFSRNVA